MLSVNKYTFSSNMLTDAHFGFSKDAWAPEFIINVVQIWRKFQIQEYDDNNYSLG